MPPGARRTAAYWINWGTVKVSNAMARFEGFRDALKAKGLPYDPELVVQGDYRIESGARADMLCSPTGPMELSSELAG